jgi:hypothetical protein
MTTEPSQLRGEPSSSLERAEPSLHRSTEAEADACFKRLLGVLNDGMLALMISVGYRTGLIEAMQSMAASTSAEIATAAGLDERYVREWLAAMTVGGVVVHDPATMTFELRPAYATALARGFGGTNSIAGVFQHVSQLGKVEDRIIDHFRHGGGVPYETFRQLWGGDPSPRSSRMTWTPWTRCLWTTSCRWSRESPSGWNTELT